MLNKPSSFSKNVNSPLMAIVNLIPSNSWIAVRCNPDASKVIGVNFVFNKLPLSIFMDINSTRLTMMNLTVNYSWIGTSFYFKTRNTIVVNVVSFKITLKKAQELIS
jgi:hypothetical protein